MQWKCRDEEEALIKPKPKAAPRGALNKNDNRALKGAQKQFSISKNVFSLSLSLCFLFKKARVRAIGAHRKSCDFHFFSYVN